jgi:predicted DNA-binding transcriptional regulator YafY
MSMLERHFTVKELAEAWGKSPTRVRRMFRNELGVVLDGEPSRRLGKKLKRSYFTMTIPESVALRVYQRMVQKRSPSGRPPRPATPVSKPASGSSLVSPEP